MTYTISAAQYANAERTAAVVMTEEAAAVLLSATDTPEEWAALLASGVDIAPHVTLPPETQPVTRRQMRLALLQIGLLPAATTWVQGADAATQIEWADATELRREHPMWPVAAAALGKTEADIDNLFALAATL